MDKNCCDDQHPLPTVQPTDFVWQPGGSDTQLTSESLPSVMVQLCLFVRGHRVGAASSVCYACHWRGMGRPKPTQAATWKPLVWDEFRRARAGTAWPATSPRGRADPVERFWDGVGVKRKHAASHEAGRLLTF